MHARSFFLGLAWLALALCRAQEPPPAPPPPVPSLDKLDGGLLEPKWFGPGPVWTRDWRADFFWAKPGVRMEPPTLYLRPWEEPTFLTERDALDYASGWEAAEFLQNLLRNRLKGLPGLRVVASPAQTPYHAMGRIVEATHIRQGAAATVGIFAGLPTYTWDFKVVDVRTGEVLLASHHRSVWAPASTWISALETPLRSMVGMPFTPPWEEPSDAQKQEDGSWTWSVPGLRLPSGSLAAGRWTAETDTGGWWKGWTNGVGTSMAGGAERYIRDRMARSKLAKPSEAEPSYILVGQIFTTPKYLKVRYRAVLTEVATGRVVARHEIRSPIGLPNGIWKEVAERVLTHLEALQEGAAPAPAAGAVAVTPLPGQGPPGPLNPQPPSAAPGQDVGVPQPPGPAADQAATPAPPSSPSLEIPHPMSPLAGPASATYHSSTVLADKGTTTPTVQPPAPAWEGLEGLTPVNGSVDKAWVSPALNLAGRTLLVGEWGEPSLKPEADSYDRQVASSISVRAPAWLYGALASHSDRGFKINRQEGDLRLEGRVVHLYQPDRSKFSTAMGAAFTFGLSNKAEGILQLRVVDPSSGQTLALVEENLGSFQMASTGIPYKAFKWLVQDLVPWLLKEGLRPGQSKSAPAEVHHVDPKGTPAQPGL